MNDKEKGLPANGAEFESGFRAAPHSEKADSLGELDQSPAGVADIKEPVAGSLRDDAGFDVAATPASEVVVPSEGGATSGTSTADYLRRVDDNLKRNSRNLYELRREFEKTKEEFQSRAA